MKALTSPDFRLFLGKSGSGKSYLARHQSRGAPRVLIHDPNGEPGAAEGADLVTADARAVLERMKAGGGWRITWRGALAATSEGGKVEAFELANRLSLAAGDHLILWDEVDMVTQPGRLPPYAYRIVNAGRHARLRVFACARRPYRLSRDLSANAGRIVAFRMTEPRDLRFMRDVMGEAADGLPGLREREALDWTETSVKRKMSPFR